MQNLSAAIVHGTGGNPEGNWFPWLKQELSTRNIHTTTPKFPTPKGQSLASWRETFLKEVGAINSNLMLFGHSIGAAFVLNLLNQSAVPVRATFLVAAFLGKLNQPQFDQLNESFFLEPFDWIHIRKNAGQIFLYAGENDPYVPAEKGTELAKLLKTSLITIPNGGHLNQDSGFVTFPKLIKDFDQLIATTA